MIVQWFKKDLEELFSQSNRIVLVDTNQEYDWLVEKVVDKLEVKYFSVKDYQDDFATKYKIEKYHRTDDVLIHSYFDPADDSEWHYMIQEYSSIGLAFEEPLNRYINRKSGLRGDTDLRLKPEELILAGKLSCRSENNNQAYWNRIKTNGKQAIFGDFNRMVLNFLDKPKEIINNFSDTGKRLFYQLIGQYLDENYEINTPPNTVAQELSQAIFNNIIYNSSATQEIYQTWLDSHTFRDTLLDHLENYDLPADIELWSANSNHPFAELDQKWLAEIINKISQGDKLTQEVIHAVKERTKAKEGKEVAGAYYWQAVLELLNFDCQEPHKIEDLPEFINLYRNQLYKLDRAYRDINHYFIDQPEIRNKFKTLYEEQIGPYLNRWFELFNNYRSNQDNYLAEEIFAKAEGDTAVIVGDAIRFEVVTEIREKFDKSDYELTTSICSGDYPSTTENNMSRLFGSIITDKRTKREASLETNLDGDLAVYELDEIDTAQLKTTRPTIIYGTDLDQISEKSNQAALKYYNTFLDNIVKKIRELLEAGFAEVHLVTDHGFVYNFDINEADKSEFPASGKKGDRFVLSNEDISDPNFWQVNKTYDGYDYLYFPKGLNPVKSKSEYGFAHGGITPQELLLPHLKVTKKSKNNLEVKLINKEQLKEINSDTFQCKIEAEEKDGLFNQTSRRINLKLLNKQKNKIFKEQLEISAGERRKITLNIDSDEYTILLLDAVTKQRLDKVSGKKLNLRSGLDDFDLD